MSYLTHLECPECKRTFSSEKVQSFCKDCNSPLLAHYDITTARNNLERDQISIRSKGIWRWRELLPVKDYSKISSLGEGDSAIIRLKNHSSQNNMENIWIKDESRNPTMSFKARGLSTAVSKASEFGLRQLTIPTAGNAGSALAAYASRAGLISSVVMPADTPRAIVDECRLYGAEVLLVDGLISDCAKIVSKMSDSGDWFSVSTFQEPYRLEGKKTMGFEIAEQFAWQLPEYIIYPTGGGTGLVGMWKAFRELQSLGWLENAVLPRMIAVQSEGCAPVVKAFKSGADRCEFWEGATTSAWGIRVPLSLADRLILKIIRESGGLAVAVTDNDMQESQHDMAIHAGIYSSPEGAATLAALKQLMADGIIQDGESVLLFVTASGVKYL